MINKMTMEIHVHKVSSSSRKYRISVTDGLTVVREVVVSGIKSRDELVWKWCDLYHTVDIIIHEPKPAEFKYSAIPSIPILDEEDAQDFFDENEDFVYDRIAQAIEEGIATHITSIRLFELNGSGVYLTSERETWRSGAQQALHHFESVENYEQCIRLRDLIDKL